MCSFWLVLWGMVLGKDFFDMFSEKIPVVRPSSKYFWNGSTNIDEPSFWLVLWGMVLGKDFFDMFSEKIPVVRPSSKYFWNGSTNIDDSK